MNDQDLSKRQRKYSSRSYVKIGEAAKILGVSVDTIRRWEDSEKIQAIRTPGGTRIYSLKELKKINPEAKIASQNKVFPPSTIIPTSNLGPMVIKVVEEAPQVKDPIFAETTKSGSSYQRYTFLVLSITFLISSLITASYLTFPKQTKNFFSENGHPERSSLSSRGASNEGSLDMFQNKSGDSSTPSQNDSSNVLGIQSESSNPVQSVSSSLLYPFNMIAKKTIEIFAPQKAQDLGIVPTALFTSDLELEARVTDLEEALIELSDQNNLIQSNSAITNNSVNTTPFDPNPVFNRVTANDAFLGETIIDSYGKIYPTATASFLTRSLGTWDRMFYGIYANQFTVTDNGDLTVKATTTLGDKASDFIRLVGRISTDIIPSTNNGVSLGNGDFYFQNGYITTLNGSTANYSTVNTTTLNATTINTTGSIGGGAGSFDSLTVGGGYGSTGVTVSSTGNISANGNLIIDGISTLTGAVTANNFSSSGVTITGGTINNTTIGATTPSSGSFTTLSASSTLSVAGAISDPDSEVTIADDLTISGTTGLTLSGAGADLVFSGSGTHSISASSGTLDLGAHSVTGSLTMASGIDILAAATAGTDIGTSSTRFDTIYATTVDATNIAGTLTSGNTTVSTFTINSDNATADTEDASLAFERGTLTPNAFITWDSASDEFDFNSGLNISPTIASTTGITLGAFTTLFDSPTLDISGAGAITGATGITSSGTITFSSLTADRLVSTTTGGALTTSISSANAALSISDETGSGALVFGTSPTITTSLISGSSSFDLLNTIATTISFGGAATTLNIGPTGSGASSVVLSGGSADTGCTLDGSTGNLTCAGNITGSSSGTAGFWTRTSTNLSPATAGDDIVLTDNDTLGLGSGAATIEFDDQTTDEVNILNANVGIGTSTPGDKLHVYDGTASAGNPTIRLEGFVAGYGAGVEAGAAVTGGSYVAMGKAVWDGESAWNTTASTQDSYLTLHTTIDGTLTERLRIASTGNVTLTGGTTITASSLATLTTAATLGMTSTTTLNLGTGATVTSAGTALNLQTDGGGIDVNIAGGSGATGCTVANATGNLTCSGNITGAATGTAGYWSRTGTTLSPATANDIVSIATTNTTGADLAVTNTGVYTGTGIFNLTANSATTGTLLSISGTGITSGRALVLAGPSSTGITGSIIDARSDVGSGGALITLIPDYSGSAVTGYGIYNAGTDATANANTDYGYFGELALTGNAAKSGIGLYSSVTSSSTTADNLYGFDTASSVSGIITTGTREVYGVRSRPSAGAESTGGSTNVYGLYTNPSADVGAGGTVNSFGVYIDNGSFDTDGTSTAYGLYVNTISGADNNYAAVFAGGNVGIGTTAPSSPLHVLGTGITTAQIFTTGTEVRQIWGTGTSTNRILLNHDGTLGQFGTMSSGGSLALQAGGTVYQTITTGGNVGIGDTGPDAKLEVLSTTEQLRLTYTDDTVDSRFTVDSSGNLTIDNTGTQTIIADDLAVNGATSADITSSTTTATLFNSTVTTLSLGGAATTLNIGPTGSGASSVVMSGGSADTGCTLDGSNGNLTCAGNITGAATGTAGYWTRTGTTLSPSTAGDAITTSGNISTSSTGSITAANGLTVTAGGATVTDGGLRVTDDGIGIGSAPTAGIGLYLNGYPLTTRTDQYGLYSQTSYNSSATTSGTAVFGRVTTAASVFTMTSAYSLYADTPALGAGSAITNSYGLKIANQGATGVTNAYGLYVDAQSGAATINYAAVFAGGNVGIGDTSPSAPLEVGDGTDSLQVSSVGDITFVDADGGASITGPAGGALAINAAATGLNLQADGAIDVNIAGGSGATGCTVTNASGNLACTGTITSGGTASVLGSGTLNRVAKFTATGSTIGDSALSDDATTLTYSGAGGLTFSGAGADLTFTNAEAINNDVNGTLSLTVDATSALNIGATGISSIGNVAHTIVNSSGALNIDSNSTGAINIGTGANAKTITIGNNTTSTALAFTSGTGSQTFTSSVATGSTTTSAFVMTANSLTTGTGLYLASTNTSFSSGNIAHISYVPGSVPTTAPTGDVFRLSLGSNASNFLGNILNVLDDTSSSVFSVSKTAVTSNIPANFTAPGDVSIAYDINFTNPTTSYIKSAAPLVIQSGETFNSSDLTLKTYNQGTVVIDSAVTTGTSVDLTNSLLTTGDALNITTSALTTGQALQITGPTSAGVTGEFVSLGSDVGSAGELLGLTPDFSGSAVTGYGLRIQGTDATANANIDYNLHSTLTLTGNADKTGVGLYSTVTSSSTTADTLVALDLETSVTGVIASGTGVRDVFGLRSQPTAGAESSADTTNVYGVYSKASGDVAASGTVNVYGLYAANGTYDTDGTSKAVGLYLEPITGADTNYGICFDCDTSFGTSTVATGIGWGNDGTNTNNLEMFRSGAGTLTIQIGSGTDILVINTGGLQADLSAADQGQGLCHSGADGATGIVTFGDCAADGADLAEYFGSDGTLEPGDVVVLNGDAAGILNRNDKYAVKSFVKKSSTAYETITVGVISTNPFRDVLGDRTFTPEEHQVPVALTGQVPVKVSTENGPIQRGDYLTSSSTPGVAMKATQAGSMLGRALQPYNNPGTGKIIILINVSYADPGRALANLSLDEEGFLISPKFKTTELKATNIDITGTLKVNGSTIDASTLLAVGSLTSDVNTLESNAILTASRLDVAEQKNSEQDQKLAELENREASNSAALADARRLGEEAVTQTGVLGESVASTSANLSSLSSRIDDLLASFGLGNEEASSSSEIADSSEEAPELTSPDFMIATGSATLANLEVTSEATVSGQLTAYGATIQDSLRSLGDTELGKTSIAGDLTIDGTFSISEGNTINSLPILYFQTSPLASLVDFFNGLVKIDNKGILTAQKISIPSVKAAESEEDPTIGSGKILAGQTEVVVSSNQVNQKSKIFVTPRGKIGYQSLVVESVANDESFKVSMDYSLESDLTFDWWIVGSN